MAFEQPAPRLPDTTEPQTTPLWLLIVVMGLVISPMIALAQFLALWRTDVVDDQMFAYFGWRIAQGATVYLDVWDNKPPGIYWVNALAMLLSGGSYAGVIAACVVALVVSHVAFFVTAASLYFRGAAAFTTILLSFYLTHAFYTGGTDRTETFLVACELMAVAFYVRGWARDRWWKWYVAGLCCGCAFLFKQVGLAAWGCMGLHTIYLVLVGMLPWRSGLQRCLLLLAGVVTVVAAASGYLAAQGALDAALFATFGFNRAYIAHGDTQFPYGIVNWLLLRNHLLPTMLLPLLMALAALIHGVLWWLRPHYRPVEIEAPLKRLGAVCPHYMLLFTAWYLVAFYGALISPHAFRHYLVPTIPPLLLLAGYLVNVLRAEVSLVRRLQQRAWVTAAFVMMGYFALDAVRLEFAAVANIFVTRVDRRETAVWEDVGGAVKALTKPDDTIQCLGYMPGVYLHARRVNVSRFTTTEKIGQVRGEAAFIARELEEKLRAKPPVLVIMEADEYFRLLGNDPGGRWPTDLRLTDWLHANYKLVQDIAREGGVLIFMRNDRFDPRQHTELRETQQLMQEAVRAATQAAQKP